MPYAREIRTIDQLDDCRFRQHVVYELPKQPRLCLPMR
ncbi:hypothetical protein CES85_1561 [Ochrobactrum quorumnocens]|uniref:Uncharacterized protein n=1 Tax=Ochrobactrum quorumnocens TaxID=271865 RepID=A0A248UFD6_9HYPH|nr:hypothetical protein CES85_1561 [[Ochrobactrum] quorumnocens]